MSAKTDYLKINRLLNEFIESLSDEDVKSLLIGSSFLKIHKNKFSKEMILKSIQDIRYEFVHGDVEKVLNTSEYTNDYLMAIMEELGISYRKKDTKKELINSLSSYLVASKKELLKQSSDNVDQEKRIEKVVESIRESLNVNESIDILNDKKLVKNKRELLEIAKLLHVYFPKEPSYDRAVNAIVDNVVGAKIRSLKIRNEL
ncbi:hypothetical protein [Enterococcus plantarum]|uniref:hypothetical protein n=1 Tax=Enterococcus plantarum TaxID=1077675 RepID=UPI001A8C0BB8|nr:hypothetical protein [Enterococcus plantarum]MBO0424162.1 hypothetical protein [Enterococcus plantarum]